jgi:DNA (cytosine-5)-methyltransferase 1
MKVLNLYAGIGGNRKLWNGVDCTAIEIDPYIAEIYEDSFPNDKVTVDDAHAYLLEHYDDGWDFIWSSPPCPTHSRIRNIAGVGCGQNKPVYPDMRLYAEIIFLNQVYNTSGTTFDGKFCVENVASYYKPLIKPLIVGRHYFWTNFHITPFKVKTRCHMESNPKLMELKGFDINDKTLLRNCTEPELGLHIFNCGMKTIQNHLLEG